MKGMDIYSLVVQEYLNMAIRKIMHLVQNNELDDFFIYITFDPNNPNVIFPEIINKEEDEFITITLHDNFWELSVDAEGFEVIIEINDSKESIYIPFEAIVLFSDQASNFVLDFRSLYQQEQQKIIRDSEIIFVEL